MAQHTTLPEGTVVAGKLRVVRQLGTGGMGAVYEVEHELTKHRRALKLLHPEMLAYPMVVARFLREASAAGHIGNPHVVETFDAGNLDSGAPYIVMEMLKGETLGAWLQRPGGMPVTALIDVMLQACDGVQAAHTAGIVHRDLKPDNIFIEDRKGKPFVKILDFGISKFDPALSTDGGSTKEGSVMGTPYYMSWEQLNGDKDIDHRTDVYALGVILYECISGQRPYEAEAVPKLSILIYEAKPTPLPQLAPEMPPGLAEVVAKAMSRNREERYQTVRELASALAPFASSALDATLPDTAQPPPPTRAATTDPPNAPSAAAAPSVSGSAISMTTERKSRTGTVIAAALGAIALVVLVVVATARPKGPPAASGPEVTAVVPPVALPSVTLAPIPTPSALPVANTAPSAAAPRTTPSAKPTGSTRVDQKGLARDNPFQ